MDVYSNDLFDEIATDKFLWIEDKLRDRSYDVMIVSLNNDNANDDNGNITMMNHSFSNLFDYALTLLKTSLIPTHHRSIYVIR